MSQQAMNEILNKIETKLAQIHEMSQFKRCVTDDSVGLYLGKDHTRNNEYWKSCERFIEQKFGFAKVDLFVCFDQSVVNDQLRLSNINQIDQKNGHLTINFLFT